MKTRGLSSLKTAFVAVFCAWASVSSAQTSGGTMVQVTSPEPPSLASYANTSFAIAQVTGKIYDGLLEYDLQMKPQPSLAEKWEISEDGRTITFHLRKGVKFHDGVPMTSEDVRFSFIEVLKKYHPRGIGSLSALNAIETPDENTAVFRLNSPAPYLIMALSGAESPILPKHVFEKSDDPRNNPAATKPIGTGAFKFVEWRRGELIRLDKNPDYWREGRPYLDRIVVRFVPDGATRSTLLELGEAHIAGFGSIPFSDARRLADVPGLTVTTDGYQMFSLVESLTFNTKRAPFDRKEVRQALSYAIDRKFIADNVYYGFATPATGQIHPNFAASGLYSPKVRNYSPDNAFETAEKMLDEAGLPRKADGVRFEATLDTTAAYGEYYQRAAEVVQQNFAKIGVRLNLRSEDLPTYLERVFTRYDFDLHQVGLANVSDPVLGVHRAFHSRDIRKGGAFMNSSRWSDPQADALMNAAMIETDPEKRKAIYQELQQFTAEQAPVAWTVNVNYPTVISKRLHGSISSALGLHGPFYDAWLE